jgi:MFS family permease
MATAASMPFFLFTLPAGAFADIVNRRVVIVSAVLWQGACAALLAFGAWTQVINPNSRRTQDCFYRALVQRLVFISLLTFETATIYKRRMLGGKKLLGSFDGEEAQRSRIADPYSVKYNRRG